MKELCIKKFTLAADDFSSEALSNPMKHATTAPELIPI